MGHSVFKYFNFYIVEFFIQYFFLSKLNGTFHHKNGSLGIFSEQEGPFKDALTFFSKQCIKSSI